MAIHANLMRKLKGIIKVLKSSTRGKQAKMDLREELQAGSKGVLAVMRGVQRRLDAKVGLDTVPSEQVLAVDFHITTFDRFDFGVSDFGVRMVMAAGLISAIGIRAGDKIEVKSGQRKGKTLSVVSVVNSTTLRFADDAAKSAESNIKAIAHLSSAV